MASLRAGFRDALQNLPNGQKNRITAAFSTAYNYQANIPDPQNPGQMIPNPQNLLSFTNDCLLAYVNGIVMAEEHKADVAAIPPRTGIDPDSTDK